MGGSCETCWAAREKMGLEKRAKKSKKVKKKKTSKAPSTLEVKDFKVSPKRSCTPDTANNSTKNSLPSSGNKFFDESLGDDSQNDINLNY